MDLDLVFESDGYGSSGAGSNKRRDVCVWSLDGEHGENQGDSWNRGPTEGKRGAELKDMKGATDDKNEELPSREHTIWLLDKFREGLGSSIDIGDEGPNTNNRSNKTGLWWEISPLASDGGIYGSEYVSQLNEPNGAAPTMSSDRSIIVNRHVSGWNPVFRSGRSKHVRENWKVVCADGGSDVNRSAVPGYPIGSQYTIGAGNSGSATVDWTDWTAGTWAGWVNGMFGEGAGAGVANENLGKMVKVTVYGRSSGSGSRGDPLPFEPANVWRRKLTWGFGWWRVELVPYVGTDRMTKVKSDGTLVLEKYAGGVYGEHTTVMEKERKRVTRRIEWEKAGDVHKAQIVKNGTLEAEVNEKKRREGEWTTNGPNPIGGTDKTVELVTNSADDSVKYKVQLEPNEDEKLYDKGSNEQIVTVLKSEKDGSGNETVIAERTSTEWADSGQYTGGWSPFVVRQVPKIGEAGFKLESRLNGKWSIDTSGDGSPKPEDGGDWVSGNRPETNGFEETNWIRKLADWINI